MRCSKCHFDSIVIETDYEQKVLIKCSNCGANVVVENSSISELLIFNYDLEKAKIEGKIAFLDGKDIDKNPYIDESYENILSKEWWKKGWAVICPHKNSSNMGGSVYPGDEDVWLKGDIEIIKRCDAIYMLNTWKESVGAQHELKVAEDRGMEVYYE